MGKSVYQQICDNLVDGALSSHFSLPEECSERNPLRWAPGALDGVYFRYLQPSGLDAVQTKALARALKSAAGGNFPETDRLFYEWAAKNRPVRVVDALQKYVFAHAATLDANPVFRTALSLMTRSCHVECVKIGMELMELFVPGDAQVREIIRCLGLWDAFTLFAVWNMRKWENGNEEIFTLAKKVHGWGRIHAVEYLKPATEEIRRWLLTEGTVNRVRKACSSLTCWQKANAEEILFGQPTRDEFRSLLALIEGLLDAEPVPGILRLDNAERILLRLLKLAPDYPLIPQEYDVFLSVRTWAKENSDPVFAACNALLQSQNCTRTIGEAVKEGKGLRVAEALWLPFRADLLNCLKKDFDTCYVNCRLLMEDADFIEPTLQVFRENLPLSVMSGDPEDIPDTRQESLPFEQLQCILQALALLPLRGTDLMAAGLKSPVARNRCRVLVNLKLWVREAQQPLSSLCPELYAIVQALRDKEIHEEAMNMIASLLKDPTASHGEDPDDESEDTQYGR